MSEPALTVEADFSRVTTKADALQALARAFDFPPTFGANWDALADSLQDLSWKPARAYVLHLRAAGGAQRALGSEWTTLLEILESTSMYWKTRGRSFSVRIDGVHAR